MRRGALAVLLVAGAWLAAMPAQAADEKDIIFKGDAKCTRCHDESEAVPVLAIAKTKHGVTKDGRSPTCTSCHGESERHANKPEDVKERPATDLSFGKKSKQTAEEKSAACKSCHQGGKHMNWNSSAHATSDVACTSCHQVHTGHDKVRDKRAQPEVCYTCHKQQRAEANKPSHHPMPEGKMACSDCHNTHGSNGPKMLIKNSVNATCFTCHAEKRGPFVHNHAPVTEDCGICHNPHGTVADSMLKTRPPFLCQQCHDTTSHIGNVPGIASNVVTNKTIGGVTTPSSAANNFNANNSVGNTQGRACLNCHTQIHGSNSPANASKAMRFWR